MGDIFKLIGDLGFPIASLIWFMVLTRGVTFLIFSF